MSGMGDIPKRGHYSEGSTKYDFMQADDIFGRVQKVLIDAGIVIISNIISVTQTEVLSRSGTKGRHSLLDMRFDITDGSSTLSSTWLSEAIDYGDKSITKAVTLGRKYFTIALFQLATGDFRDDADGSNPGGDSTGDKVTKFTGKTAIPASSSLPTITVKVPTSEDNGYRPSSVEGPRITPAEKIAISIKDISASSNKVANQNQRGLVYLLLREVFPDQELRHQICKDIFGVELWSDVKDDQAWAMLEWMKPIRETDGKYLLPDPVYQELQKVAKSYQK